MAKQGPFAFLPTLNHPGSPRLRRRKSLLQNSPSDPIPFLFLKASWVRPPKETKSITSDCVAIWRVIPSEVPTRGRSPVIVLYFILARDEWGLRPS